jgi:hypothetical protein
VHDVGGGTERGERGGCSEGAGCGVARSSGRHEGLRPEVVPESYPLPKATTAVQFASVFIQLQLDISR